MTAVSRRHAKQPSQKSVQLAKIFLKARHAQPGDALTIHAVRGKRVLPNPYAPIKQMVWLPHHVQFAKKPAAIRILAVTNPIVVGIMQ
jgi:hypothetical protein